MVERLHSALLSREARTAVVRIVLPCSRCLYTFIDVVYNKCTVYIYTTKLHSTGSPMFCTECCTLRLSER
jgi:hypothetical protein